MADGWDGLDRPYPAAYARWRQAGATEDRDEARAPLREAYRIAGRLRAEPLRVDLAGRATVADRPYGLTGAEFEILGLAYEGLDVAAIARERTVSRRTVETQRGRAYAKLGVHSLAEAITKARREHLFD